MSKKDKTKKSTTKKLNKNKNINTQIVKVVVNKIQKRKKEYGKPQQKETSQQQAKTNPVSVGVNLSNPSYLYFQNPYTQQVPINQDINKPKPIEPFKPQEPTKPPIFTPTEPPTEVPIFTPTQPSTQPPTIPPDEPVPVTIEPTPAPIEPPTDEPVVTPPTEEPKIKPIPQDPTPNAPPKHQRRFKPEEILGGVLGGVGLLGGLGAGAKYLYDTYQRPRQQGYMPVNQDSGIEMDILTPNELSQLSDPNEIVETTPPRKRSSIFEIEEGFSLSPIKKVETPTSLDKRLQVYQEELENFELLPPRKKEGDEQRRESTKTDKGSPFIDPRLKSGGFNANRETIDFGQKREEESMIHPNITDNRKERDRAKTEQERLEKDRSMELAKRLIDDEEVGKLLASSKESQKRQVNYIYNSGRSALEQLFIKLGGNKSSAEESTKEQLKKFIEETLDIKDVVTVRGRPRTIQPVETLQSKSPDFEDEYAPVKNPFFV